MQKNIRVTIKTKNIKIALKRIRNQIDDDILTFCKVFKLEKIPDKYRNVIN
jgi:hypothetical protein